MDEDAAILESVIDSPVPIISPLSPALARTSIAATASSSFIPAADAAGPTYFNPSANFDMFRADWLEALLKMSVTWDAFSMAIPKFVMVEPSSSDASAMPTFCDIARADTSATDARISLAWVPRCARSSIAEAASCAVMGRLSPISRAFFVRASRSSAVAPEMILTRVICVSNPPPTSRALLVTAAMAPPIAAADAVSPLTILENPRSM